MQKFKLTYQSENITASGVINATSIAYAWVLFKEKLKEMQPELSKEIDTYEHFSNSPNDEITVIQDGFVDEIISRQ